MIIKRPPIVIDKNAQSTSFIAIVTFVPIACWRHVQSSFKLSNQVEAQLRRSPGIVSYSLAVNPLQRHFWTYSLWIDRSSAQAFTREEPHATAVENFKDWAGHGSAFVEWESADARLDWKDAFERLKEPTFFYQKPA